MPPKMLTSTALHLGIGHQDAKGLGHLLHVGPAADVEEIGRLAAVELDEVHRAHGQSGAVDQAADVAVELHEAQARLAGADLRRLFFGQVAERRQIGMAEQGVVVEAHLGVQRQQAVVGGQHQRVDLQHAAIAGEEQLAQGLHELLGIAQRGLRQAQPAGQLADLVGLNAGIDVERLGEDPLRHGGGDVLDIHAAFRGNDQHRPAAAAIDDRAEIKLAGDRAAFFDQHAVDGLAFRPGLDGDQLMAEDVGGDRFGLFAAADQLHAALRGDVLDGSLAAAAGVDLGLDDRHRPGQLDECVGGGLGRFGHKPAGHGHARLAEDLLGLEFVNLHGEFPHGTKRAYFRLRQLTLQQGVVKRRSPSQGARSPARTPCRAACTDMVVVGGKYVDASG